MLESMRKHTQGWLAKVMLGAVILSFALWGIGNYFTGSQVETIAEIDGDAIYDVDFAATYQRQLATYANMLGDKLSKDMIERLGVKDETLQTMINRRLMLLEAEHLGLVVPDEAVLGTVTSNPAFREANGFSNQRYQALVRQMGFATPRDYENYLRQSILIDTLQKAITESAEVSDAEVKARFQAQYEQRVLEAIVVDPEHLKRDITVSDAQARDWYEAHSSWYQSPLKVDVALVVINAKDLLDDITVTDDEIKQAYADREAEFGTPEKRKASHILVRVPKDASPDVLKTAQAKIEKAKQRLAAGESFAAVAKDMSDDVTASAGGDLGFFAQGVMVPEFDDVVFHKLKKGDVSDVVRTQFGLHLIQLNDIQPAKVKPLAEVRDILAEQIRKEKADAQAYDISQDLDNALGMEDSLEAAAKQVNLPVKTLDGLTADNILAAPVIGASDDLKQKVFSMMPGDAVEVTEADDGVFVALEVLKRTPPATQAFEDVVKRVYDDVKADMAAKQAKAMADAMLKAGLGGASLDALAQKYGQAKYISKPVRRTGEGDDAAWLQGVLDSAFQTPQGHWVDSTIPTAQGIAVVFVSKVLPADTAKFDEVAEQIRQDALKAKGAVRFARWMASVRDRHDIQINQWVLNRF